MCGSETDGPLFAAGDEVFFHTAHHALTGSVAAVERDARGWSYDIFVEGHPGCGGPALCKNIPERAMVPVGADRALAK